MEFTESLCVPNAVKDLNSQFYSAKRGLGYLKDLWASYGAKLRTEISPPFDSTAHLFSIMWSSFTPA